MQVRIDRRMTPKQAMENKKFSRCGQRRIRAGIVHPSAWPGCRQSFKRRSQCSPLMCQCMSCSCTTFPWLGPVFWMVRKQASKEDWRKWAGWRLLELRHQLYAWNIFLTVV